MNLTPKIVRTQKPEAAQLAGKAGMYVGRKYREASEVTGKSEAELGRMAQGVFCSILHHCLQHRDKPIWAIASISSDGKLYTEVDFEPRQIKRLERALRLHLDFLASLPKGWLAKTSGDVGLLNQAYIESAKAGMETRR